jgi:sterol desaturase/sphingolipid hydroxylase (fatty acid hydroxylase superfamily)
MSLIIYAIPLFFALILLELWLDWRKQKLTYRFNDALNSLNLGMMSQITAVALKTIQISFYVLIYQNISPIQLGLDSMWVWAFAFIAYDFSYYWFHRMSHEINVLWAGHVVHHQSEEYNLTTALRQTSGGFFGFMFYLPMALIGIDPYILVTVGSLNLIYQFWVHTRHINRMPAWYEAIFVTPSHHRVHHAQNPLYMNKNHGGVFILWDKWFGTFQAELDNEPVIFGITKPLATWNPIWANIDTYWALAKDSWRTERWQDKIAVWFKKTGWRPKDVRKKFPNKVFNPYQQVKFDSPLSSWQKIYAFSQHLTLIAVVLYYLLMAPSFDNTTIIIGCFFLLGMLFCQGYYQQQRSQHVLIELAKNVLLLVGLSFLIPQSVLIMITAMWLPLTTVLLLAGARKQTDTMLHQ